MSKRPSFPFFNHRTQAEVPMTDHARFTEKQDGLIAGYTAFGMSRQDIADQIGCSVEYVSVRRRIMGLT